MKYFKWDIICVILAVLYNAMIIHGVVPSMFGLGVGCLRHGKGL